MLWFLPVFPDLVCSNSIARQMLVPSNKKFRTRHISSISRLGTGPGWGAGMVVLIQWDKEQVESQTLCTSTFFTVTMPESFVKFRKAKLEIFPITSCTANKTNKKNIYWEHSAAKETWKLLPGRLRKQTQLQLYLVPYL